MTKQIDINYLLDEIELLDAIVSRITIHLGLMDFGYDESLDENKEYIRGLFEELHQRRDWRRSTKHLPPRMRGAKKTKRERPRWKLDPSAVPAELRDNFVVRYLAGLTPEQEAKLEQAVALDEAGEPEPSPQEEAERDQLLDEIVDSLVLLTKKAPIEKLRNFRDAVNRIAEE